MANMAMTSKMHNFDLLRSSKSPLCKIVDGECKFYHFQNSRAH